MVALHAAGMSLVKIADRLGFSEKTVWTQLRNTEIRDVRADAGLI